MSDEDKLYIKVVVLDEIYNFVVQTFLIWDRLDVQIFSFEIIYLTKISFDFVKFKIWIFQTTSDGEMPKTKVVDIEKLCNFVVDNFFIWNHLLV